ncbi:hypothetical protein R3W88_031930 [Solanum pinnatisectum]|uniref:DUF4371 domain-containing protein n=1 Tax=Solanum pinnatisectum TaxID=50273 RepID=A0AAV9LN13_9SOLN|nr:hypothetical protein R3W88_031930 [Solanum pinnatisectum]
MKRFFSPILSKLPQSSSSSQNTLPVEENLNQLEENQIPILNYHLNEHDESRRAYIQRGPHQPGIPKFPQRYIYGLKHHFNRKCLKKYHVRLEYSVIEDAAYCLCCYLFQDESIHEGGGKAFSNLMRQGQSIQASYIMLYNQTKQELKIHLKSSVEVVRLLLNQGLAFRGHREDESSLNKGNFLEILSWYARWCDKIRDLLTSHKIQKDIITKCKLQTIKAIMEDLNGDYFALLVDESCDVSRKEQMTIVLRYFIRIVHVRNTSALCLKEAFVNYLSQHSLTVSHIRGQCNDGARNMQGRLSGLKILIQQESRSAHAIHCFALQLQLTLVRVSKKCLQVGELVLLVNNVLNMVGGSFKCISELQESQAK